MSTFLSAGIMYKNIYDSWRYIHTSCDFINIKVGIPNELDIEESKRVVESGGINLRHVVYFCKQMN
jgi:hypothetical protein